MKPLAIDLYCGLGGWTQGLLAEGYRVIGFDNERHSYGDARYPADLILQDVLTLHGRQFKDAALIVASPPCQAYSYRAMPWKRAKALPPPDNSLFEACFRIQGEACEAANRYIPLVVENVCGAQKWVGRARWHYGSFYLWGDVPALMPIVSNRRMKFPAHCGPILWKDRDYSSMEAPFVGAAGLAHREGATKNAGGSWFAVAHNTTSGKGRNPDGRLRGLHGEDAVGTSMLRGDGVLMSGVPGSGEGVSGVKIASRRGRRTDPGNGVRFTSQDRGIEGTKGVGIGSVSWGQGKGNRHPNDPRNFYSKSSARKAASAHIAKIPYELARHIAKAWKPTDDVEIVSPMEMAYV